MRCQLRCCSMHELRNDTHSRLHRVLEYALQVLNSMPQPHWQACTVYRSRGSTGSKSFQYRIAQLRLQCVTMPAVERRQCVSFDVTAALFCVRLDLDCVRGSQISGIPVDATPWLARHSRRVDKCKPSSVAIDGHSPSRRGCVQV